jgi:hypothetical protein
MSTIIQRARASGKCPPSLLRDDEDINFDSATVKVVDVNGKIYYSTIVLYSCFVFALLIYCYGSQLDLAAIDG